LLIASTPQIIYLSNFPSGGFVRFPETNDIASAGQVSIQVPQEKQSGIILFCLRIASITVEGQAFEQAWQEIHLS